MWLETITVRTAEPEQLHQGLGELIEQLAVAAPSLEVAVYSRHPSNSDVSLHLLHADDRLAPSLQGTQLAHSLRLYGSVSHAVWQPANLEHSTQQGGRRAVSHRCQHYR
ncbi:MAG: hypothetical protein AAGA68_25205 [Pseudomonadota bacterium]